MNKVILCGRLVRDVELRYGQNSKMAVGRTSIAINRGKDKNGQDKGADFPNIVIYGKQAENLKNFKHKGDMILLEGRISTSSYVKNGQTIYTTEVVADRVDFLTRETNSPSNEVESAGVQTTIPTGFEQLSDDFPF